MNYLLMDYLDVEIPEELESDSDLAELAEAVNKLNDGLESVQHVDTGKSTQEGREIQILRTRSGNLIALEFRREAGILQIGFRSVRAGKQSHERTGAE